MNTLAENDGRLYEAIATDEPGGLSLPFPGAPFPCLIWDHDGRFTEEHRSAIARSLLEAGCRYAVCGGQNSEAWHDAVDAEFVRQHLGDPEEVCEAVHVMTTRHAGETPDEVAFFFVLCTNFHDHDFAHYLVLHVGAGPAREQVDAAVRKYALNTKAV